MHGLTRRQTLLRGMLGATGLTLMGRRGWSAPDEPPGGPARGKAAAVIELWLGGGPSHLDTFDPKPEAGPDWCGPLGGAAATKIDGMRLGELLPMLATQAERFSIIRSMTHGVNAHETAAYMMQTGRSAGGGGAEGLVYPSFGAIVSMLLGKDSGARGRIPPFVVLTRPQGRFAVEGFLGMDHRPFCTGGDPKSDPFAVEGIVLEGVSEARQRSRRELLSALDTLGKQMRGSSELERFDHCGELAYDLILGDAGQVFDLTRESDAVRDRYGRTTFGQSCLAARRLVEEGVPYVTINSGGWDTHKRHFESMRQKLPDLDRGFSALLEDLAQRGLLESTIVWCTGEFGRSPRVQWDEPWNGGRSHHGACFSTVVAGGGFRGGHVVGASDATGGEVADRPVSPRDLLASMFELLGIDPAGALENPRGLVTTIQPPADAETGTGRLAEIL